MIYLSLGTTCSIAFNLRLLNIRLKAYPFDWIRIQNLNNLTKIINNSFNDFLNYDTFQFVNESDKFEVNGKMNSYIYKNNYCKFYHEFDKELDRVMFNKFKEKYKRRVNRFMEVLKSNNQITFIREEIGKVKESKIINFINTIKLINPNIDFKLVIITNDELTQNINIDNVKFHYSNLKVTDWRRPELDWKRIFNI